MISLLLFALASVCNAIMDTCQHHYNNSIFSRLNQKFWNAEISWKNKYVDYDGLNLNYKKLFSFKIKSVVFSMNLHPAFTDAWHLFKSLQIILITLSIVFYSSIFNAVLDFVIFGFVWNVVFSINYNHILKKR